MEIQSNNEILRKEMKDNNEVLRKEMNESNTEQMALIFKHFASKDELNDLRVEFKDVIKDLINYMDQGLNKLIRDLMKLIIGSCKLRIDSQLLLQKMIFPNSN